MGKLLDDLNKPIGYQYKPIGKYGSRYGLRYHVTSSSGKVYHVQLQHGITLMKEALAMLESNKGWERTSEAIELMKKAIRIFHAV